MSNRSWSRKGGYEVSSQGDLRFSPLFATMPDGRTIEMHYQCDVKGYDPGGRNWRLGKGKPTLQNEDPWVGYYSLWRTWAKHNSTLFRQLLPHKHLSDRFAASEINQARALTELLFEYEQFGSLA